MLTCNSALLYLLGVFKLEKTVSPAHAKKMTPLTPTTRLSWLLEQQEFKAIHSVTNRLLEKYAEFLEKTDRPKDELIAAFNENSSEWMEGSYTFGDLMFEALSTLGEQNRFYRLIVV